ncbi:MAG: ABC transporter permease, partial [Gammaproteobacteria bacterium]
MKYVSLFLPRLGGRRASFKIGVVATLAIAVAANIAVLGNLGVLFGHVVPGATHQHLLEPYFQPLQNKALPPSLWGIYRRMYDRLSDTLDGRADTALYQLQGGTLVAGGGGILAHFLYLNVTPSLARVLGVRAVAGRTFTAADEKNGAAAVIMIAAHVAREHFGGVEAAVGKTLKLDGKHYRVVGVLADTLTFPAAYPAAGWVPMPPEAPGVVHNVAFGLHALVRPHRGLSAAAVKAALARAYTQALPDYNSGMRSYIEQMKLAPRVETLAEREYGPVITQLQLLELAALLLLLLVFANLAGLATSDALARRHELATRVALGAGTFRLFVERARELGLLGLVGWGIGVGLGWLGGRALTLVIGQAGPTVTLSVPVLLLTLAAVLVITTLLATGGIRRLRAPRALCADLMSGGHTTGGRGLARALRAFIVLQLALSVVLLVMAGHLRVNVFGLTHGDLGFTPAQRTFFMVTLPRGESDQTDAQYKAYVARASAFDRGFLDRLNGLAGVKDAALLSIMPFSNGSSTTSASTSLTDKAERGTINRQTVSKRIAPTLGLHVLAGNLNSVFYGNGNATFLDAAAIKRFWPESKTADVIGRTLYVGGKAWRVAAVVEPLRMKPYG